MSSDNSLLGVVLLARHGDRVGFYQDPTSYNSLGTVITPTGTQQELQLGQFLRSRYLDESSSNFISNVSTPVANVEQISVRADAGGEGGVILNSAIALLQGLFPATTSYNETLANGTTIIGASSGYQFIPIESVDPDNDVSLEGWTSCNTFDAATEAFYASPGFQAKASESAGFLNSIKPYLDQRPDNLENMWNIFDYLNVRNIHDANFHQSLPPTVVPEARDLANYHEYGVFSDPELGGIGNIAGRTILPSILEALAQIADPSEPMKIQYQAISYKPFLSLFNMTGVAQQYPELAGIVDYAAAVALEVRSSSGGPVIRFNFKNGTQDDDFKVYNIFGASNDVPLTTFVDQLAGVAINDTSTWCAVCQNSNDRGCGALTLSAKEAIAAERLHPVGAGLLGAGMAVAFMIIVFLFMHLTGFISCGRKAKRAQKPSSDAESDVAKV